MGILYSKEKTLHSAAGSDANGPVLGVEGFSTVGLQAVISNTAVVYFEGSIDGSNWVGVEGQNVLNGSKATSAAASGIYAVPVAGLSKFRARLDWTSGTVTVKSISGVAEAGVGLGDITLAANNGVDIGDVDVATIAAGETHIGEVGGADVIISQTPTVTAGAYSANDAVGGMLTFANAARASGLGGIIKSVVIVDDAGQDAETELWLFDTTITAVGDNAGFTQTEAELHTVVAVISSTEGTWRASGTPSVCDIECSRGYTCTGTSLFGQLVTRGTPTEVATDDITVRIQLVQN